MEFRSTKEFEKWATGFSGCDGGNLKGAIWFCGIEYGGNEDEKSFGFEDVSTPGHIDEARLKKIMKYQYNIKVAKFYAALLGKQISSYYDTAFANRIYDKDSDIFRMNLYPISFHSDSDELWQKWLYEKTGFPTKSIYRAWCQIYRFEQIRQWVKANAPKLIVATGASYRNEFILAFDGINAIYENKYQKIQILDRELIWLPINNGQTILAVTPFLGGRYGLNSDALLQNFGLKVKEICKKNLDYEITAIWR